VRDLSHEEEGMGETWAASHCCWDVPVRAAAEDGKYVGTWVSGCRFLGCPRARRTGQRV